MKKYLLLTTLFASTISFAVTLTPVNKEAERCEYYQTKNNKTPIGKVIGAEITDDDDDYLYLGLNGKEIKFARMTNNNSDEEASYWKNGNTTALFKTIKIFNMPDNAGKYLESFTLKTNNQIIIKQNLLRICEG